MRQEIMVSLGKVKVGQRVEIADFLDSSIRCCSARFGIEKGQVVTCVAKPGPVVIQRSRQEIAIGKDLSERIYVKVI